MPWTNGVEINTRLKKMCMKEVVGYWKVDFNPWKGGCLG